MSRIWITGMRLAGASSSSGGKVRVLLAQEMELGGGGARWRSRMWSARCVQTACVLCGCRGNGASTAVLPAVSFLIHVAERAA